MIGALRDNILYTRWPRPISVPVSKAVVLLLFHTALSSFAIIVLKKKLSYNVVLTVVVLPV